MKPGLAEIKLIYFCLCEGKYKAKNQTMKNIFKKTPYPGGWPIEDCELRFGGFTVETYYLNYRDLLAQDITLEYPWEWVLKEYVIYYLNAPLIGFPLLALQYKKNYDKINLATMILQTESIGVAPFII